MNKEIQKIFQALEEHLSAINENTSELQALFDYVQEVESKIEKLSQRLDQLQLSDVKQPGKAAISPLNQMEKKVFLILYTEEMPLTFQELSKKTNLALSLIPECVSSLVQKGIPLHRSHCREQLVFTLDKQFKELQAKENVVNLSLQSFLE